MARAARSSEPLVRCRWRMLGRVQGVGFRPLVYRVAARMGIGGAVWNDGEGVVAEGQGTRRQLDEFLVALRAEAPAAAVIRQIIEQRISLLEEGGAFEIRRTPAGSSATAEVAADLAVCPACLKEMRDPANLRRYRYALTNCTDCGPRFSLIRAVPYDRCNTTMTSFAMCPTCRGEYERPADRRFHAQPTACRKCGPQVRLLEAGQSDGGRDPIERAAQLLLNGKIVAIKGIGGFHLAARADDQAVVQRLRQLKHRPAKPFAVMCASLDAIGRLVRLSAAGARLIASPAAPIVLALRWADAPVAPAVAENQHRLGVMLAYTPLHHLLFDQLQPCGVDTLVMTSGNDIDQPLVFEDAEAPDRLAGLCDAILLHNRPIQRAVDDSVLVDAQPGPIFIRRARGYVPEPLMLPAACDIAPGLAVGAEMKCTVATCRGGQVVLSQHLGNLTHPSAFEAFRHAVADLCGLFAVTPGWIAHDLHPAYLSAQYARQLAGQWGVPLVGVQHHHAHAAAVLAENGVTEPVLAVVCDGTGYGADGTIWGGELLVASLDQFSRIGRLRPMLLPGGDACAKQPWRSAMSLLHLAFGDDFAKLPICRQLARPEQIEFLGRMLRDGVSCVSSSSTGRLFDGIAGILQLCRENRFDAEAPMALEAAAAQAGDCPRDLEQMYGCGDAGGLMELDLTPLVRRIVGDAGEGKPAGELAMLFHQALTAAWAGAVARAMEKTGLRTVALSGGVFCNELFADVLGRRLENIGARVLRHRAVPANDGGIAFGQAAVAAARVKSGFVQRARPACV